MLRLTFFKKSLGQYNRLRIRLSSWDSYAFFKGSEYKKLNYALSNKNGAINVPFLFLY